MAEVRSFTFNFNRHASWSELPAADQELLKHAVEVAAGAYAPYSKFHVGAALRLRGHIARPATSQFMKTHSLLTLIG